MVETMMDLKEIESKYAVSIQVDLEESIGYYSTANEEIRLSKEVFKGGYNIAAVLYHELGHHEDLLLKEIERRYFTCDLSVRPLYEYAYETVAFIHSMRIGKTDNLSDKDYYALFKENYLNMLYYIDRLEEVSCSLEEVEYCMDYIKKAYELYVLS